MLQCLQGGCERYDMAAKNFIIIKPQHISETISSSDAILTLDVNIPGQMISIEHFNEKGELQNQMLDCPFNNETLLRFSQVNQQVILF